MSYLPDDYSLEGWTRHQVLGSLHESDKDLITVILVICQIYGPKTSKIGLSNAPRANLPITDLHDCDHQ